MKKLVLIGCLLALSGQVLAANWILLSIGDTGILYGDSESRTGNKAWFKRIYLKTAKRNGKNIEETKGYFQANCSTNQITLLSSVDYDRSGNVIDSFNIPSHLLESHYVIPDTRGETIFKFICNRDPS